MLDSRYCGFFDCFNRGLFFEAHDVLEPLWLEQRPSPNAAFYKGLIPIAGAFVHLQKDRLGPAKALFRLADANLAGYGGIHERLDVDRLRAVIGEWLVKLDAAVGGSGPGLAAVAPQVRLRD